MKFLLIVIIVFIISGYVWNLSQGQSSPTDSILPNHAQKLLNNPNYVFLDVRTVRENEANSIPDTPVIPINELASRISELEKYKDQNIIVYCQSGSRSNKGTILLNENGFNAVNLTGGLHQWNGPVLTQ